MYILYIDESGTPDPVSNTKNNGCSNTFVVGGILIEAKYIQQLENDFYLLKENFLTNPLLELKYNTKKENIKIGYNKETLRLGVFEYIKNTTIPFQIICLSLDKHNFIKKAPINQTKDTIYSYAFQALLENVNLELNNLSDICLGILDSRDKKDNKILYYSYINLIKKDSEFEDSKDFSHLLPSIAFSDSAFCLNLCVADFCCASVFQLDEYNHPLYFEMIKNKFKNCDGEINDYGIVRPK